MNASSHWFTGQLLLALPGIGDPRFEQAVIVMVHHDEQGAMGISVADCIAGMTVGAAFDQLDIPHDDPLDQPIYLGGPLESSRGFVLHSADWTDEGSVKIGERWKLSTSHDVLHAIGSGKGPAQWIMALGYAGWSAGQLETEIVQHGWHIVAGNDAILFDIPATERWTTAFADAGIDARLLTANGGEA